MIDLRPSGIQPSDLETLVGRIVMSDASMLFPSYTSAGRVMSLDKKTMEVCELNRELNRRTNRMEYLNELYRPDGRGTSMQLRTAKLICDTASEVNAIRELQERLEDEHSAFLKSVPERFKALATELLNDETSKAAVAGPR